MYRNIKGWTQKELAEQLNLATGTVQQYELGKRSPSLETLQKIAKLFDVSMDDLTSVSEYNDEYELICETLRDSGFNIEQAVMADEYIISHADDKEPPDERETIEYSRLAEIIHKVLEDAEIYKKAYIQKRLETELFWPKINK